MKPYAESCDQNKNPILEVLREELSACHSVLEVGSGTGQHAVHFAQHLPHLQWQTSDCIDNHPGIHAWLHEAALANTHPPIPLDVLCDPWPQEGYDAIFSANTVHIMSWEAVKRLVVGVGAELHDGGLFCLYGPFNYGGQYTSDSNARFDQWLKDRDPRSGIRNFENLNDLAEAAGMTFLRDHAMPANNHILVWKKKTGAR